MADGNPTRDVVCDQCYPNTWDDSDAEDCVGGECGYQWGGAVRIMKWNDVDGDHSFGCEPCADYTRSLVLPLFRQDGTDIGYDTGYCAPDTCKGHCFEDNGMEHGYAGYVFQP